MRTAATRVKALHDLSCAPGLDHIRCLRDDRAAKRPRTQRIEQADVGRSAQIEITESNESAPTASLHAALADGAAQRGYGRVLVSLSAEADIVVACAAIEPRASAE